MKVTKEMLDKAVEMYGPSDYGPEADREHMKRVLEAVLADVPDLEEAVRAVAALWSGRVQAAEAKLAAARAWAERKWRDDLLDIIGRE